MFGWSRLVWGLICGVIGVDMVFVLTVLRRQQSRRRKGETVTKMARVIFWMSFAVLVALVVVTLGALERRRERRDDEARSWREIDRQYVQPAIERGNR